MKILQVSKLYYPWVGGVEKHVKDLVDGIKEQVAVEVLACQPKGKECREEVDGVLVTRAGSIGIYLGMPLSFSFPRLLRESAKKADILHFHSPFPLGEISLLLFGFRNKKVVVTYHSDIVRQKFWLRFYRPFLQRFLRRADCIIVTSQNLLDSSPFLQPQKKKCHIVPLGIDIEEFKNRQTGKVEFLNQANKKIVLFVGRLVSYKGLEFLLKAMRDVDALLLIVGEGPLREQLESLVKTLRLESRAVFLGKLSDEELKYCYEICDVFVLPSVERTEAFGIVQLEAMLAGKPVVNTDLPTGVPFVSTHQETGFTVPPRDAKALSVALNTLLGNEKLADAFGRNAVDRVRLLFSKETMIKRILEIYEEVLS